MKLQVTQENLSRALGNVARTASTRSTLPILSNVLLKTVGNRLSIAATNLDIAITHHIGSKISEEGAITVPARLMQDFIGSLPSGVIDLELSDNKLHISTDKYESTINGVSAEDFPVMPDITKGTSWSVGTKELKTALQQVIIAASNDEARPVLTGVYIHTSDSNLFMVATDSYRLAEKRVMESKEEIDMLVPANAMQDLLRIIDESEDEVKITHDEQQVLFQTGDIELVTRLIDGQYPDYRNLIPKDFQHSASLDKSEFINITKVSSLFARESAGSITLSTSEKDKLLSIKSVASQVGDNTASASADITGEGSITLNSRYVLDALNAFQGDRVSLKFNGKLEPSMLTDPNNSDYTHIIMPLKS